MLIKGLEVIKIVNQSMGLKRNKIWESAQVPVDRTSWPVDQILYIWPTRENAFWFLAFLTSAVDRCQGPVDRSTADLSFCFGGLISTVGSLLLLCIMGFCPSPSLIQKSSSLYSPFFFFTFPWPNPWKPNTLISQSLIVDLHSPKSKKKKGRGSLGVQLRLSVKGWFEVLEG